MRVCVYSRFIFWTILLFIVFSMPLLAAAENRVVIIAIPRLILEDVTERTPHLLRFIRTSSTGLMTTPNLRTPEQIYHTLNAGTVLRVNQTGTLLMDATESYRGQSVGHLYTVLTGFSASSEAAVHIGFPQLYQLNPPEVAEDLGSFGSLLHGAGLKTAVIGNCDTETLDRSNAALLMDKHGLIDYGAVGGRTNRADLDFPAGFRTDSTQILADWRKFNQRAQVILVTLGDLERLESYDNNLSEERWSQFRRSALLRYDALFGSLMRQINSSTTLTVLLSTMPPQREQAQGMKRITPLIFHGPGFGAGLLTSAWNLRKGYISYHDSTATILHFLGIPKPAGFRGALLHQASGDWKRLIHQSGVLFGFLQRVS